jgi:hypothetical protein
MKNPSGAAQRQKGWSFGSVERREQPSSSCTGSGIDVDDLAVTLGALARSLHEEPSVEATLRGIVVRAVGTVPGAQQAGLPVIEARRVVRTQAGSAELVYQIDRCRGDGRRTENAACPGDCRAAPHRSGPTGDVVVDPRLRPRPRDGRLYSIGIGRPAPGPASSS